MAVSRTKATRAAVGRWKMYAHIERYFIGMVIVHPQDCSHCNDIACDDDELNANANLCVCVHAW
jgi:hypothetical protein